MRCGEGWGCENVCERLILEVQPLSEMILKNYNFCQDIGSDYFLAYLLRLLAHEFWLAEREGDVTIPNHVLQ